MLLNGLPDSMARSGGANSLSNLQHLAGRSLSRNDTHVQYMPLSVTSLK